MDGIIDLEQKVIVDYAIIRHEYDSFILKNQGIEPVEL
jgi:hypothetical protein